MEGVFYVGKGKNARSLQHLKDARDQMGPLAARYKVSEKKKNIKEYSLCVIVKSSVNNIVMNISIL